MKGTLPKYEAIINFETTKVKEAVNKFIELNRDSDFHVEKRNDISGYYVLRILKNNFWNGYSAGNMNISVQKQEIETTKIMVETQNTGMKDPENFHDLAEAQAQFLHALFSILSGNLTPKAVMVPKVKGCLGILVVLGLIGTGVFYYLFSLVSNSYC